MCFFFLCLQCVFAAADTTVIKSPNGTISFKLFQRIQQLYFAVTLFDKPIVDSSPIGFLVDGVSLTKNIRIGKTERYRGNETYSLMGVHVKAINHFNSVIVHITPADVSFQTSLEIRVFNDGIGFRHRVVSQKTDLTPVETTVFNLPLNSTIWYHDLNMHYEGVHVKKQIQEVHKGEWVAPPATFKLPQGSYASITEAALTEYPGMALQANGKTGLIFLITKQKR